MADTLSRDAPVADATRDSDRSPFRFEHREEPSVADLIKRLAHQSTELAHKQVELVKAEVGSAITQAEESAAAMAGAAVLGIAGLGVVLMGVAFLLGQAMSLWLATLIVGFATLLGAYAMFAAGRAKLHAKSITAERSRRTLERAPEAVTGHEEGTTR
jgi:hypothetical protein